MQLARPYFYLRLPARIEEVEKTSRRKPRAWTLLVLRASGFLGARGSVETGHSMREGTSVSATARASRVEYALAFFAGLCVKPIGLSLRNSTIRARHRAVRSLCAIAVSSTVLTCALAFPFALALGIKVPDSRVGAE